jgi:hypothetical protein
VGCVGMMEIWLDQLTPKTCRPVDPEFLGPEVSRPVDPLGRGGLLTFSPRLRALTARGDRKYRVNDRGKPAKMCLGVPG